MDETRLDSTDRRTDLIKELRGLRSDLIENINKLDKVLNALDGKPESSFDRAFKAINKLNTHLDRFEKHIDKIPHDFHKCQNRSFAIFTISLTAAIVLIKYFLK